MASNEHGSYRCAGDRASQSGAVERSIAWIHVYIVFVDSQLADRSGKHLRAIGAGVACVDAFAIEYSEAESVSM